MKRLIACFAVLAAALTAVPVLAADNKAMMPIADALAANDAQARLGDSVKFYFGNQPTPKVLAVLGAEKTSQKTNAVGKSTGTACNWVFLSDMLQMQKYAKDIGANAVIHIVSNYNNVENSSETEFECHVGAIMAGVAFKAQFVKIAD